MAEFNTTLIASSFTPNTTQIVNAFFQIPAPPGGLYDYSYIQASGWFTWSPTSNSSPSLTLVDTIGNGYGGVFPTNTTTDSLGRLTGGMFSWPVLKNFSGNNSFKGLINDINANIGQQFQMLAQGNAFSQNLVGHSLVLQIAPGWPPVSPDPPIVRMAKVAPNLFYQRPVFPPFEPQPPPPPVHYPARPIQPGFSNTEFFPSGGVILSPADLANIPLAGAGGGSGDFLMSCMRRKGGVYGFLSGAEAMPAIYCVNLPGDAEFLFFSPGLVNAGGASGQTSYGFRIYRGLNGFKPGAWATGYPALSQAPDYVGAATLANLIPWQGTLQFCVEVYGLAALPASSLLDFTVQGLDT